MKIKPINKLVAPAARLFESLGPLPARKAQFDFSSEDWNEIYRTGRHKEMWDLDGPDPGAVVLTALLSPGQGKRLLEIGCGSGADSIHFAKHGYAVSAIDVGDDALAQARARAKASGVDTINWIVGDIRDLELPEGGFDLAYDRGCLHCLSISDWPAYGRSVHRLLKPKAPLFVFGCRDVSSTHFAPLTRENLAQLERWFSVEVLDEVQLCASSGHLRGGFALLRCLA